MNVVYAIQESPFKWAILAGIAVTTGFVGTMAILIYNWSHAFGMVWFLAGLVVALYCLVRLLLQWKEQVNEAAEL